MPRSGVSDPKRAVTDSISDVGGLTARLGNVNPAHDSKNLSPYDSPTFAMRNHHLPNPGMDTLDDSFRLVAPGVLPGVVSGVVSELNL